MLLLGPEFYPRREGVHLHAIVFCFVCEFGKRFSSVVSWLHSGQFFFHNSNNRIGFENNTLKSLWKSRVENNGGKCAYSCSLGCPKDFSR